MSRHDKSNTDNELPTAEALQKNKEGNFLINGPNIGMFLMSMAPPIFLFIFLIIAFYGPSYSFYIGLGVILAIKFIKYIPSIAFKKRVLSYLIDDNKTDNCFKLLGNDRIKGVDYNKTVMFVAPHGPGLFPVLACAIDAWKKFRHITNMCVADGMLQIPLLHEIMHSISNPISTSPKIFYRDFLIGDTTKILYPGGVKEMFENHATNDMVIRINVNSRLFKFIHEKNVDIIPVLNCNEFENYSHSYVLYKICRFIHENIVRVGIPFPCLGDYYLPCMSRKTTYILYGNPLKASDSETPAEYAGKYLESMKKLHEESYEKGYSSKKLIIQRVEK